MAERATRRAAPAPKDKVEFSLLTDDDLFLFNEGSHFRLYEKLGAHEAEIGGRPGAYFAVWAPDAERVSVLGDFNHWRPGQNVLHPRARSGIWEGFIPGVAHGELYKFHLQSRTGNYAVEKADPFGFYFETPPKTAACVWNLDYAWNDQAWMRARGAKQTHAAPMAIYEVHLGSWMRLTAEGNRSLTYREAAPRLTEHVKAMGFTHVEFLPLMEHPFYGSWGYQITGYFAPTSRYGSPQDFMYLVDYLHQNGIGVIIDWVPSHFPNDQHGLGFFDGTHLFEHADPRQGFHPDWASLIFNYGRNEVRSFLISDAFFWLDRYHVDGLRVDAVASMLYLDYSRREGEWIPNPFGGRENLDAIQFLRRFNEEVYKAYPDVQTIAEESTAWPGVSRPTYLGGLGFGYKWDMGWMHDTLQYFSHDPVHRKFHHNELTFRMIYAFTENFVLPLSHDEVVHGKGSLLSKMPGDDWQRFANLRLLYAYMYAQPGKKLLFMGAEIGGWREWSHEAGLEWDLMQYAPHAGIRNLVTDLNRLYRTVPALHAGDVEAGGFEWIDGGDTENSVISFMRCAPGADPVVAVLNFTPVPREHYRVGVPAMGRWREIFNSDAGVYGGSGLGNLGGVEAQPRQHHARRQSIELTLPPLGALFFQAGDER